MMTIRKIENSVVLTLSKEFLESIGASESDIVFVDEEKLKAAIAKKEVLDEEHEDLEMMIAKSAQHIFDHELHVSIEEKSESFFRQKDRSFYIRNRSFLMDSNSTIKPN